MKVSLRGAHGRFLTAEIDGTVVNDRDHTTPGLWEMWDAVEQSPGIWSFQSHHGGFLCASWGGGSDVHARSSAVGPDELFRLEQADGRVGLRTHDGEHFVSALDGPYQWAVVASPTWMQDWELFVVDPPLQTPAPPVVRPNWPLRIRGSGYTDKDGAPVIPRACHWGESFSAYVHCKSGTHVNGITLDQWRAQAREIAKKYNVVRNWDVVGFYDSGWEGREVSPFEFIDNVGQTEPPTPGYYGEVIAWLTEIEEAGLSVMLDRGDLNSWSDQQKLQHMFQLGWHIHTAFGRERGQQIVAGLWAVNEAFHNGVHDPALAVQMIDHFRRGAGWVPNVAGLADYDQTEDPTMLRSWSRDPATVMTCHPLRDVGNPKRMLEHYFSNGYGTAHGMRKPGWYTEPVGTGPDVTVGQISDPEYLCSLALASVIGGCAFTYLSSPGIFFRYPSIHLQPGFNEVADCQNLLPPDVMQFDIVKHAGSGNVGVRPLIADDRMGSRFDYAIDSRTGRFAGLAYAEHGVVPMMAERRFSYIVHEPHTGKADSAGVVNAGQSLMMSGKIARLVVGQL